MNHSLVSAEWLFSNIAMSDLVILDASSSTNKAALAAAEQQLQIRGARRLDIAKDFSDSESPYPNMLIDPAAFKAQCEKLGINNESKIVVYDNLGIYTSPRAWWMFKTMGHEAVAVLDGGLPEWIAKGFPIEKIVSTSPETGSYHPNFSKERVKDLHFIQENIESQSATVIDARSAGRFAGTTPEPRAGLRGGHIPKSKNLPYTDLLQDGKYKSPEAIRAIFANLALPEKPLVFTCGSGITACIVLLASTLIQDHSTAVYDGSWTEWAQVIEA
ncbi:MAG: sulfurtransferase [Saprospiraceae bacterium]